MAAIRTLVGMTQSVHAACCSGNFLLISKNVVVETFGYVKLCVGASCDGAQALRHPGPFRTRSWSDGASLLSSSFSGR